jgi:hypothetical protein
VKKLRICLGLSHTGFLALWLVVALGSLCPQPSTAQYSPSVDGEPHTGSPAAGQVLRGATNGVIGPPGADATYLQGATMGTIGPQLDISGAESTEVFRDVTRPPQVPGATNGTIGPPGGDANVLISGSSVNNDVSSSSGNPFTKVSRLSISPSNLPTTAVNICAALAIFLVLRRKRAEMWMMAAAVASIMVLDGLACGLLGLIH